MILATVFLLAGFALGVTGLIVYMLWRIMRNKGMDKSNVTNAARILDHVVLHPNDFGKMYYLTGEQILALEQLSTYPETLLKRPFWYVNKDELSEVVKTRP